MPNRRTTAPGLGKNKGSTNCSAVTAHQAAIHKQKLVAAIDQYSFRLSEPRIVHTGGRICGWPDRSLICIRAVEAVNDVRPR
jgi:predicted secreted protein